MQNIPFFNNTTMLDKLPVGISSSAIRQKFSGRTISRNFMLCFALSGETMYTVGNTAYKLSAGTCTLCPPYIMRRRNSLSSEETPLHINVAFHDDFLTSRGYDFFPYGGELAQFNGRKIPHFCNFPGCGDEAIHIIRDALNEFNLKNKASFDRIASLIAELFGFICTEPAEPPSRIFRKQVRNINKAVMYIENNCAEKLTIDALCEISEMSRRSFTEHFNEITGLTVTSFLLSIRLNRAAHLLATTDLIHDEIARRTGLGDHSNLAYIFSKHIGLTPSEYRSIRFAELRHEAKKTGNLEWINKL